MAVFISHDSVSSGDDLLFRDTKSTKQITPTPLLNHDVYTCTLVYRHNHALNSQTKSEKSSFCWTSKALNIFMNVCAWLLNTNIYTTYPNRPTSVGTCVAHNYLSLSLKRAKLTCKDGRITSLKTAHPLLYILVMFHHTYTKAERKRLINLRNSILNTDQLLIERYAVTICRLQEVINMWRYISVIY